MNPKLTKSLLAILATAAGVTALSGSAQAAVYQNSYFYMNRDTAGEVSLMQGNLANDWSHSTISPEVTGDLKVVNGDDANFRVRVDSIDLDNNVIGTTYYTPKPNGFKDDAEHHFAVDMSGTAAPNLGEVEIALEKNSSGTWKEKDHFYLPVIRYPKADDVKILDTSIDVGGSGFSSFTHEPTDSAKVSWHIEDDGQLTASYDGWLHMEPDFFRGRARVMIRALNGAGKAVAKQAGPARYQQTPEYQSDEDKLSVTSADAARLQVAIQEWDDYLQEWTDIAGDVQTVGVGD
jgi:hypothetical protein